MREFTSAVQTVIDSSTFKYFLLMEIELYTNTYYYTTYHRDISWNGYTWLSDGGIFEFDPPNFSSILDREAYKVVLTDINDDLANEFKGGVVGRNITIRVGLVDPTTDSPLLATNDIMPFYKGTIDSPSITVDWDTKLAILEGSSPMADLDQVNVIMVSKDGMDQLSSADTSYDKLYDDNETQLKWGKI